MEKKYLTPASAAFVLLGLKSRAVFQTSPTRVLPKAMLYWFDVPVGGVQYTEYIVPPVPHLVFFDPMDSCIYVMWVTGIASQRIAHTMNTSLDRQTRDDFWKAALYQLRN